MFAIVFNILKESIHKELNHGSNEKKAPLDNCDEAVPILLHLHTWGQKLVLRIQTVTF